jgi:3-hydroxyisobutyrate dehydrogenase-like beta-hydroxyacid dehydrogenase
MDNLSNQVDLANPPAASADKPAVLFVGLGTMGLPMASNLVRAGFDVRGVDTSDAARAAFAQAGGRPVTDAKTAAASVDVIVTMLPDDKAVRAVLDAPDGLLAVARRGALVIDMSTTAPSTKIALARVAHDRGIDFVESPVGKTMEHAIAGTLALMVAGEPAAIERARPVLAPMGNEVHLCGAMGAASAMKLINNMLVACINAASIEALVAGRKANLGLDTMLGVFKTTLAWNNALAVGLPRKAFKRDFKPGFMTRLAHKDVGLALAMARDMHVPLTQGQAAYAILEQALRDGYGGDDNAGSMLRVCEANGGTAVTG